MTISILNKYLFKLNDYTYVKHPDNIVLRKVEYLAILKINFIEAMVEIKWSNHKLYEKLIEKFTLQIEKLEQLNEQPK